MRIQNDGSGGMARYFGLENKRLFQGNFKAMIGLFIAFLVFYGLAFILFITMQITVYDVYGPYGGNTYIIASAVNSSVTLGVWVTTITFTCFYSRIWRRIYFLRINGETASMMNLATACLVVDWLIFVLYLVQTVFSYLVYVTPIYVFIVITVLFVIAVIAAIVLNAIALASFCKFNKKYDILGNGGY